MADTLVFKLKDLTSEDNLKKIYTLLSKTRSSYNKDLNEIPRYIAIVRKYVTDKPQLAELTILIRENFPNNFYNMDDKKIVMGLFNADLLSHELEHALNVGNAVLMPSILKASKAISSLSSSASLPLPFLGAAIKLLGDDKAKHFANEASDILALIHGLAITPTLFEEGRANMGVVAKSNDRFKSLGSILPAYGTYLAHAMLPMMGYQAVKLIP